MTRTPSPTSSPQTNLNVGNFLDPRGNNKRKLKKKYKIETLDLKIVTLKVRILKGEGNLNSLNEGMVLGISEVTRNYKKNLLN